MDSADASVAEAVYVEQLVQLYASFSVAALLIYDCS